MKHLVISELLILSDKEGKAIRLSFDRKLTVIVGANNTGKSTIIKSIYHSFGAEPVRQHPRFKGAEPKTLVKFSADDVTYQLIRDGSYFAIFSGEGKFLKSFNRVTDGLAPYLANLFDFGLVLASREGEPTVPPPAFLFLPFYMDQDSSWVTAWSAFDRLYQFTGWRDSIVEYHTGIKDNAYYRTNAELITARGQFSDAVASEDGVKKVLRRLESDIAAASFSLDPAIYGARIERMLSESHNLATTERTFKSKLTQLHSEKSLQNTRLGIAQKALGEISQDFNYLVKTGEQEIECPTCGTNYSNDFAVRFAIASDEDRVVEFIAHITAELARIDNEIQEVYQQYAIAQQQAESIQGVLNEAQGELTLAEVIESEGRRAADNLLTAQLNQLGEIRTTAETKMGKLKDEVEVLNVRSRSLRADRIEEYADVLRKNFVSLDVQLYARRVFEELNPYLFETGSTLPRALLAYQFAILELIAKYSPSTVCPIVIDSPNQQGQDREHLPQILRFLATAQPVGTQMVLGIESELDVSFPGTIFKTPDRKYSLLSEHDFDSVHREFHDLMQLSIRQS